jgi:nitroimidazol reductase NimA-like FMN-containing flavoprotein (pyridoxamine 5'-phosphate oxidase superfamily)
MVGLFTPYCTTLRLYGGCDHASCWRSVMLRGKIRTVNNLATKFDEYFQQLAQ